MALQDALRHYETSGKAIFISDLISIYYKQIDNVIDNVELSPEVCGCILYKYIQKDELNRAQFIQISQIIIQSLYPHLNIERFGEIAQNTNVHISGKIFIKDTNEFMS
eukprot:851529_1